MPLLLLLVALALLAAVAVVAAGQGGAMSEASPDLPPTGVPDGRLEPEDLRDVRFASAVRGYRMEQVDEVLDRLAGELAERDRRIAELESRGTRTAPEAPVAPPRAATDSQLWIGPPETSVREVDRPR